MTLSEVGKNLELIEKDLSPFNTKLLPVSKTFPVDRIMEAYHYGYKAFGENRVQELLEKYEAMPKDINWHLIGHLQSNKAKYIAPFIALIHSVDSEKLLLEINKQAAKVGRQIDCLLQVYIAKEETKFGWDIQEIKDWYSSNEIKNYPNIKVIGLMGMASNSPDEALVRQEFSTLKSLFEFLKQYDDLPNSKMEILSMGMSGDFKIAAEEGSTLVRMGSAVFGSR
jgi:pyridoxal phosphate enzyme (YggS family)